jgi:hypothetical protein
MGFVYRELCTAIMPPIGLSHSLAHWPEIARGLAESPRKRSRQKMTKVLR